MHKSKEEESEVIYMLDLEKSYDRIDWGSLKDTLHIFEFPKRIITLIMHVI